MTSTHLSPSCSIVNCSLCSWITSIAVFHIGLSSVKLSISSVYYEPMDVKIKFSGISSLAGVSRDRSLSSTDVRCFLVGIPLLLTVVTYTIRFIVKQDLRTCWFEPSIYDWILHSPNLLLQFVIRRVFRILISDYRSLFSSILVEFHHIQLCLHPSGT